MQVLGCHLKMEATAVMHESYVPDVTRRNQWPADNGTACLCRGSYDSRMAYIRYWSIEPSFQQCIATCADDIQNHHVSHSDGTGRVTADCPEGMAVLGCGSASRIDAVDNSTNSTAATHSTDLTSWLNSSALTAVVVNTTNSCRCFDEYGQMVRRMVRCYAVCSMFDDSRPVPSNETSLLSTATRVGCDSLQKTAILCVLGLLLILAERD